MTIGYKIIISLLLVVLISILAVYSVLKYNNKEIQGDDNRFFYSVEKGENIVFSFLYSAANFNWFKGDRKLIHDSEEGAYSTVEEIKEREKDLKNIDLYQLIKESLKINNWSALWNNYWQTQPGWFNKEVKDIVN